MTDSSLSSGHCRKAQARPPKWSVLDASERTALLIHKQRGGLVAFPSVDPSGEMFSTLPDLRPSPNQILLCRFPVAAAPERLLSAPLRPLRAFGGQVLDYRGFKVVLQSFTLPVGSDPITASDGGNANLLPGPLP